MKLCSRCDVPMVADTSIVFTSNPPQYLYECPRCGKQEYGLCSENLEDEATKYAQDKYMPVQTAEAFRAGYNKCRQEMMNSAIEREVKEDAGGYPYIDATELYDYENDKPLAKAGDRVKVVFIKDK